MNDAHQESVDDLLNRAVAALRNAPVSNVPSQRLVSDTIEVLNSRVVGADVTDRDGAQEVAQHDKERKQRVFRLERYGALAAAVLLMIAASIAMWLDHSAATAFAQVIKKVKEAKSVIFTDRMFLSTPESNSKLWSEGKTYLHGDLMRSESSVNQNGFEGPYQPTKSISIGDWQTKKVLLMDPTAKTASWLNIDKVAKQFINPIEAISALADKDGEFVGEEELNGRKTRVFKLLRINFLTGGHAADLKQGEAGKIWIDAENKLPVKIAAETLPGFGGKKLSVIFDDFIWNQSLDAKLFSMEIPEGYKVVEPQPDAKKIDK